MKRKQLWKKGFSMLLASAMIVTAAPVTASAVESTRAAGGIAETALAYYDFDDFSVSSGDQNVLTDGTRNITLEGSGTKPVLLENTSRGKALSLTAQGYANRADALLPGNPFAGQPTDNGFTLNFWTKTVGATGGGNCLVDFEVAPATSGRAGTLAVNQKMVYWNTTDQESSTKRFTDYNTDFGLSEAKGWQMVTMTITQSEIAFYTDGKKISHSVANNNDSSFKDNKELILKDLAGTSGIAQAAQTNVRLGASLATYWNCAGAWLDDVSFYGKALTASEVQSLYNETNKDNSLQGIAVTGADGVDVGKERQLGTVLIPADSVAQGTVTWSSDNTAVATVSASGKVRGVSAGTANITASVDGKTSEPFQVTVFEPVSDLAQGYYMTVYSTTKPFYTDGAWNIDQETQSVYVAVSEDGQNFQVLNNGGGVVFSKNTKGSMKITEPRIFKTDGGFKIVAADADLTKGYHEFTSKDGVHYYDDTITQSPNTAASLSKDDFSLLLNGANLLESDSSITLGNAISLTAEEYKYIVDKLGTVVNTGLDTEKFELKLEPGETVTQEMIEEKWPSVDATYSDGSTQKFNVDWSGALEGKDFSEKGEYEVTGTVIQTKYLNKLKELNGSNLPDDDPNNANPDVPTNYDPATGKVYYDATKYVEGLADPFIYWDEQTGYYYMTGSYFPQAGDAMGSENTEQYDRVTLRRSRTLEGLQTRHGDNGQGGENGQVTIWKVGNQGYENNAGENVSRGYRYIWAPEIHRVGDYWVVYFTESQSANSAFGIYSHALILDGDKDPYETALTDPGQASEWKDYQMRMAPGVTSRYNSIGTSFCLDMTYFKDQQNGKSYVIWAGKPTASHGGDSTDLFIATVDEERPWMLTSPETRLTCSEYGWERIRFCVNEGPTVLQHDGNIFMCYSACGTGSEYMIGMCSAKGGEDLLDIANWTKSPYPLLSSRDVDGEEGPGHNSFTVDQDGNAIFVYHARPTSHNYKKCGNYNSEALNDPCRHARLKRVHWAADGTPILRMVYADELLEENSTVTLKVKVAAWVKEVSLNKSKLSMKVGDTEELKATITPDKVDDPTITWTSEDAAIASVDNAGKVTAKKPGTTKIIATAASGVSAECEVTVEKTVIAVTGVTLSASTLSLKEGETGTLTATVEPKDATDTKLTWTSSDQNVATVDANGKVTALKAGTAKIKVTAASGVSAECTVTVTAAGSGTTDPGATVTKLTLNKKSITIGVKEKVSLKATVNPKNAKLSWTSSKPKIATVSGKGQVTAKKAGKTVITVKAGNKTAKCTVTVKKAPNKITLNKKSVNLKRKRTFQIKVKLPKNTASYTIKYTSSNKKVAKVSSSGKVTAVKKGSAKITAKTFNGKKAVLKVKVK